MNSCGNLSRWPTNLGIHADASVLASCASREDEERVGAMREILD
jgi:hypothetical protein